MTALTSPMTALFVGELQYAMEGRLRIAGHKILIVFTVLAAVLCIPLGLMADALLLQHCLPTPGTCVWRLVHPDPVPSGFLTGLGSLLDTMFVVDSICWFIVLMALGLLVDRAVK